MKSQNKTILILIISIIFLFILSKEVRACGSSYYQCVAGSWSITENETCSNEVCVPHWNPLYGEVCFLWLPTTETCGGDTKIKTYSKMGGCADVAGYNGAPCEVLCDAFLNPCGNKKYGKWDDSENKCIICDGSGKTEEKICGDSGEVSCGCSKGGNSKCESACPNTSPQCDEVPNAPGVAVAGGVGGVCNNCVFFPPVCSWQNDACGQSPCAATERHQTCGPAGCSGGVCTPGSTRCAPDSACLPCEETCTCPCPDVCPCPGGDCPEELRGGLVPCGKICNDPCTKECECCPCTLCHLFVLFKRIVDFGTVNVIFPLAILMIVVGGVMFLTAGGDPGRISGAKKILTATVIGIAIILVAWLIIDTVITFVTPAGSPFQAWHTINCPIEVPLEVPPALTCNDTDSGDRLVKGVCTDERGSSYFDFCRDESYLIEYTCIGNLCGALTGDCPPEAPNCYDGACHTEPPPSCNDTDGGPDPLVNGTCTDATGSYTDFCGDTNFVVEYFCEGDSCESSIVLGICPPEAPNCIDGACVP